MSTARRIHIGIDGKDVEAFEGELLLVAARRAGIDIPSLCWHRKLSPTGACRLCVVKIEGSRGMVTSCSTPVTEGMAVTAFDEELEATRRFLLESLLSETVTGSDGSHRDEFAELCHRYGLDTATSGLGVAASGLAGAAPRDESSPVLSFDPTRCIKCFRCVKACDEIQGKRVIAMTARGSSSLIAAGDERWSDSECDGCGECVQLCPTGALVEKPHRERLAARGLAATSHVRTTCPYCGVGCQLDLSVLEGSIARADGVEGLSPNDGRLCVKGRFGYDFVAHKDRLTRPLIREEGGFREASWDEALETAAKGFLEVKRRHGSDALAGYSSAKCTNEENYLFQKLVRIAFGTNNLDYCTRLCHASTVTAMLEALGDGAGSNSIEDFEATDCLLVTGNNMIETHPVTATYVKRGRARGASLVVIDPRHTPLADLADVWLQPRLGTDVALLNGMTRIAISEGWIDSAFVERRVKGGMESLHELERRVDPYNAAKVLDTCGVGEAALREATRLYATAPTAIIATGMGMSQQTVGTNNVFALMNLMLVTGQIGKPRAGLDPPRGQNNVQGATDVGASPLYYPGYIRATDDANRSRIARLWGYPVEELPGAKGLTTVEIMKAAGEGTIKALYVMGENPMHTDPNLNHVAEAMDALDFLVVQDLFMTATAQRADVIFPAASFAEKDGSFTNSDRRVLRVRKAVESPGEAKDDAWILQELAWRMHRAIGPHGARNYPNASAIWDEIAQAAPMLGGISHARIETSGIQWPCPGPDHPGTPTLFLDRFNTPDGLARIVPVDWLPQAELPDADWPFVLNTGRILYQYHSSTMSLRSPSLAAFAGESWVLANPADAARLGLAEGEKVRILSRRGFVETRLRLDSGVLEGELFMPFHFPDALVNLLTRDELDPRSRIAPFKMSACRMEKA